MATLPVSRSKLVKDVLAFSSAAVLALVDGKLSQEEIADLILKGQQIIIDLSSVLKK